jgi:hypothetical protein
MYSLFNFAVIFGALMKRLNLIQTATLVGLGCLGFNADLFFNATKAQSQQQEARGIAISSLKCERQLGNVKCSFLVIDKRQDPNTQRNCPLFRDKIRAFDSAGTEYVANEVQFGRQVGGSASVVLVYEIPVRASATFVQVSPNLRDFVGFAIQMSGGNCYGRNFVFRNVAIVPPSR